MTNRIEHVTTPFIGFAGGYVVNYLYSIALDNPPENWVKFWSSVSLGLFCYIVLLLFENGKYVNTQETLNNKIDELNTKIATDDKSYSDKKQGWSEERRDLKEEIHGLKIENSQLRSAESAQIFSRIDKLENTISNSGSQVTTMNFFSSESNQDRQHES